MEKNNTSSANRAKNGQALSAKNGLKTTSYREISAQKLKDTCVKTTKCNKLQGNLCTKIYKNPIKRFTGIQKPKKREKEQNFKGTVNYISVT